MPYPSCRVAPRLALGALLLSITGLLGHVGAHGSELRRDALVRAIERAQPAVVNIHGEKQLQAGDARFGPAEAQQRRVNGMGTGVIIDERGYILTNQHVVDGVAKINVTLCDGTPHVAQLVAVDAKTDLAVIRIEHGKPLPTIHLGTSRDLMLGEAVVAVGNAYGYENTVTRGIISALHRSVQVTDSIAYDDLIQTDASINPGNSGGPLINIDGEMIGVNVAVRAGALGIGFAIPVDRAVKVASELLSTRVVDGQWHGIVLQGTTRGACDGCVVATVDRDSPASEAGLRPGDVVRTIGDVPVNRALDLERALIGRATDEPVEVAVVRDQEEIRLPLVLARLPSPDREAADAAWESLGLRLEKAPAKTFQKLGSRYRGGLKVVDVRVGSPAAKQGIRKGDLLVGMHIWETVSLENVDYVIHRSSQERLGELKFYILRGNETLYGFLQVARRTK